MRRFDEPDGRLPGRGAATADVTDVRPHPGAHRQTAPDPPRPRRTPLYRLGVTTARWRHLVFPLWMLLLVGAGLLYPALDSRLGTPDYLVPGSESARVQTLLSQHFPALGTEQNLIVFRSGTYRVADPPYQAAVERILDAVRGRPHVTAVVSPYESPDDQTAPTGQVAVALVNLDGSETARNTAATDLQHRVRDAARGSAVEAYLTGPSPLTVDLSALELDDQNTAELIGIPIALLVLVFALGGLVAAILPMVTALSSVLVCTALLSFLAGPLHLDRFVMVITTVIGIGVGIDYALFIVSRFREELAKRTRPGERRPPPGAVGEAVGTALRTSGRTVVTSGIIVIVALASMVLIRGHIFMEIAVASALVIGCCLVTALTLLPALLAILGHRVNAGALPRRLRPRDLVQGGAAVPGRWAAWARLVLRRPLLLGLPALLLILVLSVPVFSVRLGLDWGLAALGRTPSGQGQQLVANAFTPGAVGPVDVVVCGGAGGLDTAQMDGIARLSTALRADHRVSMVVSLTDVLDRQVGSHRPEALRQLAGQQGARAALVRLVDLDAGGGCTYLQAILGLPVDAHASSEFVGDLRRTIAPQSFAGTDVRVYVGGLTAQHVDIAAETTGKLPWVIALVLGLSFCYLLVAFRSVFMPVKAVILTMLATAASLGLTVFVFQFGHGERLLHFTSVGTLQAYLPVALFALLFGLSMDYEVFLVSRIQEEWLATSDNAHAVATGLDHTARQITAGAAIMVAVFGSLMVAQVLELKQFGFGLALAVLLDATVVRMLLVPAAMGMASGANWYLPRWLRYVGLRRPE